MGAAFENLDESCGDWSKSQNRVPPRSSCFDYTVRDHLGEAQGGNAMGLVLDKGEIVCKNATSEGLYELSCSLKERPHRTGLDPEGRTPKHASLDRKTDSMAGHESARARSLLPRLPAHVRTYARWWPLASPGHRTSPVLPTQPHFIPTVIDGYNMPALAPPDTPDRRGHLSQLTSPWAVKTSARDSRTQRPGSHDNPALTAKMTHSIHRKHLSRP